MTICDKINTIGETLQENLNDRGVDCTFGGGTGESTISDMVGMVSASNFKGVDDVNLSITANRPYLLENETTDVIVKLEDGLQEPLTNKNVIVGQSVFRDNGVTGDTNSNWYKNSGTDNRTVTATGTTLANTTSTRYDIFAYFGTAYDIYLFQSPFTVEFDVVNYIVSGSNRAKMQIYDKDTNIQYNVVDGVGHWKIVCDGTTCMTYKDGVKINEESKNIQNARVGFYIQQNCSITYKNFVIYEIINGVTDEKGEFALYNVSVTDDTVFNASYGTETATTNVYLCQFVDYGITSKHNDNWTLTTNMQRTRNDSYTTLSNIGSTSQMAYPISNTTKFSGDISIEWENYATTYQLNYLIIRGTSDMARTFGTLGINKVCNVKITVVGTSVKSYIDGVQKDSYTINRDANNKLQVRLQINPTGDTIKYSNFRIKPL